MEIMFVTYPPLNATFAAFAGYQNLGKHNEQLEIGDCSEETLESATEYWLPKLDKLWGQVSPGAQCVKNASLILHGDSLVESASQSLFFALKHCS